MADNYLEKQRELYEGRKAVWEKANKDKAKKFVASIRERIVQTNAIIKNTDKKDS